MSLLDALAQQAQQATLQQTPGTGGADAIAKGIALNQQQQQINADQMYKAQQLKQQMMQQFMEREQQMLAKASDSKIAPGARKNYLEYASRMFAQWSGAPGYSDDFKGLMTSDNQFAAKYGSFMSQMLAAGADPQAQAEIMENLRKAATAAGEDAVFISQQFEEAMGKRFSLIGQVNQSRGQQETADRQMFNSIQNQLEASLKDLSSLVDDKGNAIKPPTSLYEKLRKPYDAVNPASVISEKTAALEEAQALIQQMSGKKAKTAYSIDQTKRAQDKLASAQSDFQNAMNTAENEYLKTSSGAKRVLGLIKKRDAAAVEMSVALIQRSMGDVGNMAVQEQNRYKQSGALNDISSALAYLTSNPDLKTMTTKQFQTLDRAVRSAYEIQADIFKSKIVGEVSRRSSSLDTYEKGAFKKGGPGWRQAQQMLNRIGAEVGKKYSLADEMTVGETGKAIKEKRPSSLTPAMKEKLRTHIDAINKNKGLTEAQKKQKKQELMQKALELMGD